MRILGLNAGDLGSGCHGHGGWREGGETHFRIQIVSPAFKGKSRVDIHRAINNCVADELKGGVHALAIEAKAE